MKSFFIIANKPSGFGPSFSSFSFLKNLKKKVCSEQEFEENFNQIKIGHSGTLDAAASGLMLCAVNEYTKFLPYIPSDKTYEFEMEFGKETDSCDLEGSVIKTCSKRPLYNDFVGILKNFVGNIKQIPNKFSALKINGKKAYELARNNIDFEIKPRDCTVYSIILKNVTSSNNNSNNNYIDKAFIQITCSSGFYIRTLAYDIAKELGCIACVSYLNRLQIGNFSLNQLKSEEYKKEYEILNANILKNFYTNIALEQDMIQKLQQGQRLKISDINNDIKNNFNENIYCISLENRVCGLVKIQDSTMFPLKILT